LASQWNLWLKYGDFGIFSTLKSGEFGRNFHDILHIRVFSPNLSHKKIGKLVPQNGKIS
jgi:hypothetical protein